MNPGAWLGSFENHRSVRVLRTGCRRPHQIRAALLVACGARLCCSKPLRYQFYKAYNISGVGKMKAVKPYGIIITIFVCAFAGNEFKYAGRMSQTTSHIHVVE